MDRQQALALIYESIDRINEQLPPGGRLARQPSTVIVGQGGSLDSLGIVTFVLALEEKSAGTLGYPVQLFDPDSMAQENSPFHTVDRLASHLTTL
jgi:D-alanine--poly(phosphoribitol) ligase subunit 2